MKLNRFIISLACCALVLTAQGQNLKREWAKAVNAIQSDLPATAVRQLWHVYHLAGTKGETGYMLRAAMAATAIHGQISEDSATVEVKRVDSIAAAEKRPTERALWKLVAASLHMNREGERDTSISLIRGAMADLSAFSGHKAAEYVPAVIKGSDSQYFDGDLLNIVSRRAADLIADGTDERDTAALALMRDIEGRTIASYRAAGKDDAVILMTIDSLRRENTNYFTGQYSDTLLPDYRTATRLIKRYPDSKAIVEAYIYICSQMSEGDCPTEVLRLRLAREGVARCSRNPRVAVLRNIISNMKQGKVNISLPTQLLYPGQRTTIRLNIDNKSDVSIRLYRLPLTAVTMLEKRGARASEVLRGVRPVEIAHRTYPLKADSCLHVSDSISWQAPAESGIYLIMPEEPGKDTPLTSYIYVSRVRLIYFTLPHGQTRITAVDARSGKPLGGARVCEYDTRSGAPKLMATYTTDSEGKVIVSVKGYGRFGAEYQGDVYTPLSNSWEYPSLEPQKQSEETIYRLFTDRAVYRPSQSVKVGGIVYSRLGDEMQTVYAKDIKIRLYDARGKKIAEKNTKSDEYGAYSAVFSLPADLLPGTFRLEANGWGYASIEVEEYKRPTFEVTLSKPDGAFAAGDTVEVKGHALTYTNTGVQSATVSYEVTRRPMFYYSRGGDVIYRGTTTTDEKGDFTLRVPLTPGEKAVTAKRIGGATLFSVQANVTAVAGETQSATLDIMTGREAAVLSTDMPAEIDRDSLKSITIELTNHAGAKIETAGSYTISHGADTIIRSRFVTGRSIDVSAVRGLASGRYTLRAVADSSAQRPLIHTFTIFSLRDKHPADTVERLRLYAPSGYYSKDGSAIFQIGTPLRDAVIYYDMTAGGKLVESKQLSLSDTLCVVRTAYRPEYGDGAAVSIAMMRDGRLYTSSIKLLKPLPDKKLREKWTTFRDKLRTGSRETWKMHILNPDDTPASAAAIMTIYDASLDKLRALEWNNNPGLNRYVPSPRWHCFSNTLSESFEDIEKSLPEPELSFDHLYDFYGDEAEHPEGTSDILAMPKRFITLSEADISANDAQPIGDLSRKLASSRTKAGTMLKEVALNAGSTAETVRPRTNFAETAFFSPTLRTDDSGDLTIEFTVPESLTRWNVRSFLFTKTMNWAQSDTTVTVTREFSITPALPRFLRLGDRSNIASTLRNMTDRTLRGTARMTISDASSLAVIWEGKASYTVKGHGETVVTFSPVLPSTLSTPLLICRVTAEGDSFADGEQRYIPLLSDMTETLSTLPFILRSKGPHTIAIPDSLRDAGSVEGKARLTAEYTPSPAFLAIEALPHIDSPRYEDAITLATAYYATAMELHIGRTYPAVRVAASRMTGMQSGDTLLSNALLRSEELKNMIAVETPWAADAAGITLRQTTLASALDEATATRRLRNLSERLGMLQHGDGGFGWWSGMSSSYYITERVAHLLLRLKALTGLTPEGSNMLKRAMGYLDAYMAREISKLRDKDVRPLELDYLDILRLSGKDITSQGKANRAYLLQALVKNTAGLDMKEKATAALVLQAAGKKREAATALASIMEHTVSAADRGRFFDSYRSPSFGRSYRIPTQTAAIEALRTLRPEDRTEADEMLLWLLQAKHMQAWETPIATVDAVNALLLPTDSGSTIAPLMPDTAATLLFADAAGRAIDNDTKNEVKMSRAAGTSTGYVKASLPLKKDRPAPKSVIVTKGNDGLSWGSLYTTRFTPATEVNAAGRELRIERRYYLVRDGKEKEISDGGHIRTGDLIRVRFTVTADRDYDYICVRDPRPACLEPVRQNSGYTYDSRTPFYLSVRDASEEMFIESLPKGKHDLSLDFRADRSGTYMAAPATVQCHYAPEYAGRTRAFTLHSDNAR